MNGEQKLRAIGWTLLAVVACFGMGSCSAETYATNRRAFENGYEHVSIPSTMTTVWVKADKAEGSK